MNKQIAIGIVEDLEDIRKELETIIRSSPDFLLLGSFSCAEDAIAGLAELRPDIIIMDINLPGINGIECIRKLSSKCPSAQFMMFTIYENSEQVFEALEAGATGYLLKNTPYDKILESLLELKNGGSPMSAHIARKVVASFRRTGSASAEADSLTQRENGVLELLSKGYLYKEIATKLGISTGTVRQHIHKIYEKLHVQNRTEALNKVFGHNG